MGFGSTRGGILKSALALAAVLGAGGTLAWMVLAPGLARSVVENRTGFAFKAESLACNPLGFSLEISGAVVGNPQSFGGGESMLELDYLAMEADAAALARGEYQVRDLELRLPTVLLVRDERGRINLSTFLSRLLSSDGEAEAPLFRAQRTRLVVDRLVWIDHSQPTPQSFALDAKLDLERFDLESLDALFDPLLEVVEVMRGGESLRL